MTVAEFWRITPGEALMFISAATWRAEREQRQALEVAWHTASQAALAVYGKQKPLDRWLKNPQRPTQPRTPKQAAAYLEMLFSGFPRKKKEPKP